MAANVAMTVQAYLLISGVAELTYVSICMHLIPPFYSKTNINVSASLAFALILRELSKSAILS